MDTQTQGNGGRRRRRGGKGRKNKQKSGSPEPSSTGYRKDNPTCPQINDTNGDKLKKENKPGPMRQSDDKPKSNSIASNSQINSKKASKNRTKTSQSLLMESSAHKLSSSTNGNSTKARKRSDLSSQSVSPEANSVSRKEAKPSLTQTIASSMHSKQHTSGSNTTMMDCKTVEKLLQYSKSPERPQVSLDSSGADFQNINYPVRKNQAKTSLPQSKETSAHIRPRTTARTSGRTDDGTAEDHFRQFKLTGTSHQQPSLRRSEELVSDIVKILVTNGGSIQISSLQKSYKTLYLDMLELSSDKTFEGFVKDHGHVLRGSPDAANVKGLSFRSDLEICKAHGSSVDSCRNWCRSLHICKFQMMNECSRGRKCLFGHNLRNDFNQCVLKFHHMEKLSDKQVREFLGSLNNRRGLTVPGICSYYNSSNGCGKPNKCPFLHICEHYIRGDCRYGIKKCCYSHDLSEDQPKSILDRYGLSRTRVSDLDLQTLIHSQLKEAYSSSSSYEDDSRSQSNVYDSDEADVQCNGSGSNLDYSQMQRHQWGRSGHYNEAEDMTSSSCGEKASDSSSGEYGEETDDAYSGNDNAVQGQLPTANKELQCLPAWTCESTHQSVQQESNVTVHDKEEHNELTLSAHVSSGVDDTGVQPHGTRSLFSYDHGWRLSSGRDGKTTELTAGEHQELNFLYQTYLRARQCTTLLSGRTMTINFETMTVRAGDDEEKLVISMDSF